MSRRTARWPAVSPFFAGVAAADGAGNRARTRLVLWVEPLYAFQDVGRFRGDRVSADAKVTVLVAKAGDRDVARSNVRPYLGRLGAVLVVVLVGKALQIAGQTPRILHCSRRRRNAEPLQKSLPHARRRFGLGRSGLCCRCGRTGTDLQRLRLPAGGDGGSAAP